LVDVPTPRVAVDVVVVVVCEWVARCRCLDALLLRLRVMYLPVVAAGPVVTAVDIGLVALPPSVIAQAAASKKITVSYTRARAVVAAVVQYCVVQCRGVYVGVTVGSMRRVMSQVHLSFETMTAVQQQFQGALDSVLFQSTLSTRASATGPSTDANTIRSKSVGRFVCAGSIVYAEYE
jgi:hypothetical protein